MQRQSLAWFTFLLCLSMALPLGVLSYLPAVFSSAPPPTAPALAELRGVWLTNVSSAVLFSPWGVNRALQRLAQLNFNTVYPVIWNRGHTFFASSIAREATGEVADPFVSALRGGSDVLAEIVEEASRLHLRVIPWFEYGFMVPADSTLARHHPDWLTQNRTGQLSLGENQADADFLRQSQKANFAARGWQWWQQGRAMKQVWLNPLHPEVQTFIKGMILEVVGRYDVGGIQLDDHFGLPVELGYDSLTVKRYQAEHQGRKPPDDPCNPEWRRWRAAKLTAFLAEVVRAVRAVKPQAKVSLSPNSYRFSYQNYLQDWKTWVERGLVDELVLQVYRDDLAAFEAELSQPEVKAARRRIPVGVGILTGTWNRPIDIQQIAAQVKAVRDRRFAGVSFFYWETLWGYLTPDSPRQRRRIFESLFAEPARASSS